MPDVTVRDETTGGRTVTEFTLPGVPERLTARELIRLRVREEVARYNLAPGPRFNGLVQPAGAEADLNGCRLPEPGRHIDWEQQADAAERAFTRNGFIVLIGDRQVESLDEVVSTAEHHEVVLLRLVPLAGG